MEEIRIINQSNFAEITQEIRSEIEEQIVELEDKFSGPVVIRDVPGYEGRYFVVSCGQIWSLLNKRGNKRASPFRLCRDSRVDGYYQISCLGLLHRVIAKTFGISNTDNKPEVNHKDEIKTHNFVIFRESEDGTLILDEEKSNLEWMTRKENADWGTRNARAIKSWLGKDLVSYDIRHCDDIVGYNKARNSRIFTNGEIYVRFSTLEGWLSDHIKSHSEAKDQTWTEVTDPEEIERAKVWIEVKKQVDLEEYLITLTPAQMRRYNKQHALMTDGKETITKAAVDQRVRRGTTVQSNWKPVEVCGA